MKLIKDIWFLITYDVESIEILRTEAKNIELIEKT